MSFDNLVFTNNSISYPGSKFLEKVADDALVAYNSEKKSKQTYTINGREVTFNIKFETDDKFLNIFLNVKKGTAQDVAFLKENFKSELNGAIREKVNDDNFYFGFNDKTNKTKGKEAKTSTASTTSSSTSSCNILADGAVNIGTIKGCIAAESMVKANSPLSKKDLENVKNWQEWQRNSTIRSETSVLGKGAINLGTIEDSAAASFSISFYDPETEKTKNQTVPRIPAMPSMPVKPLTPVKPSSPVVQPPVSTPKMVYTPGFTEFNGSRVTIGVTRGLGVNEVIRGSTTVGLRFVGDTLIMCPDKRYHDFSEIDEVTKQNAIEFAGMNKNVTKAQIGNILCIIDKKTNTLRDSE